MQALTLLAFVSAALSSVMATTCSPGSVPSVYDNMKPVPLQQIQYDNSGSLIVNGNVMIKDGCTFQVTNFNFTNGSGAVPKDCFWYGYLGALDSPGNATSPKVVDDAVPQQNNTSATFTLTSVVGRAQSFNDFNILSLFCIEENRAIAQAQLSTQSALAGNAGSNSSSPPSSKNTNGASATLAQTFKIPSLIAVAAVLALFL